MPYKKPAARVRDAIQKKMPSTAYGRVPAKGKVPAGKADNAYIEGYFPRSRQSGISKTMQANQPVAGAAKRAANARKRTAAKGRTRGASKY